MVNYILGGCDKTVRVFDCRSPESHLTWIAEGELEKVVWNPMEPYMFFAGTSVGTIELYDCRKGKKVIFKKVNKNYLNFI